MKIVFTQGIFIMLWEIFQVQTYKHELYLILKMYSKETFDELVLINIKILLLHSIFAMKGYLHPLFHLKYISIGLSQILNKLNTR